MVEVVCYGKKSDLRFSTEDYPIEFCREAVRVLRSRGFSLSVWVDNVLWVSVLGGDFRRMV